MVFWANARKSLDERQIVARGLIAGVVLVNAFLCLLVALELQHSWTKAHDLALARAQTLSRLAEENLRGFIAKIDFALLSVENEMARQEAAGKIDRTAMEAFIARTDSLLPGTLGVRIHDANAMVEFVVNGVANDQANVRDRDYFRRLKDDRQAGLIITPPLVGRISGGVLIVAFARRLNHADGSFAGEIHVSVAVDQLLSGLADLDLGRHGMVTLYNDTLAVLSRAPVAAPMGASTRDHGHHAEELRSLVASGAATGSFHSAATPDGLSHVVFLRKIAPYPLSVTVALADEDILADWRQEAIALGVFAGGFVLLSSVAAWLLARIIHQAS